MHLLLTRPEADARELAGRLAVIGITTTTDPLLAIEHCLPSERDVSAARALVVTSRHALEALAASPQMEAARRLPVFVVGPATARMAHEVGFATVIEGPATARDLVGVIAAHSDLAGGTLVHLRGDHVAFDMAVALRQAGIAVDEVLAYRSVAAKGLRAETIAGLAEHRFDGVVLMSPRTAETYARLVVEAGLIEAARAPMYLCLSQKVARALELLGEHRSFVPVQPNSEEMLALVERLAALSGRSSV
jgi:uroporphyrinogen-III synthase